MIKYLRNLAGSVFVVVGILVGILLLVTPQDREPVTLPTKPGMVTHKVYTAPVIKIPFKKSHKPYKKAQLPFKEKKLSGVLKVRVKNGVGEGRTTVTLFRDDKGRWWYPTGEHRNLEVEYIIVKHDFELKPRIFFGVSLADRVPAFTLGVPFLRYKQLHLTAFAAYSPPKFNKLNIVAIGGGVLYVSHHFGAGVWGAPLTKNGHRWFVTVGYVF